MLNIALPDHLEVVIAQQAEQAGFDTATDYLVHLILREQERISQQEKVEVLLLEGLESGNPIEASDEWWEEKRSALIAQLPTE